MVLSENSWFLSRKFARITLRMVWGNNNGLKPVYTSCLRLTATTTTRYLQNIFSA